MKNTDEKKVVKKSKKYFVLLFAIIIIASVVVVIYIRHKQMEPWYKKHTLIAHAMGGIDGNIYTNSLEAFQYNYDKGYRVFEIDLLETSDGVLVGQHSWNNYKETTDGKRYIPTSEEFLSNDIAGGYTGLSFEDVLRLAKEYSDIYVVTDTKKTKSDGAREATMHMLDVAKEQDMEDVFKEQFIVQVYNKKSYQAIKDLIDVEHIIFTFYRMDIEKYYKAAEFCSDEGIPVITYKYNRWKKEVQEKIDELGLVTALYTVNNREVAIKYVQNGVSYLYTDDLEPSDFGTLKMKLRPVWRKIRSIF